MTSRERMICALNHTQPDRVPYCISFTQPAFEKMAQYFDDRDFMRKLDQALVGYGMSYPESWKMVSPDIWRDEFGVEWNRSVDKDIGVVCNRAASLDALDEYRFPDPADPQRWQHFPKKPEDTGGKFVVANIGFSLFERAWTLVGMEELLTAMVENPDAVDALLDAITNHNLQLIEHACQYAIDAMMFGDDWGSQTGVIMGVPLWRRFIKPRIREMYEASHRRGKYVFIHSCGKVDSLFPDLIECGVDCFNPFQPEVMDVYEVKRRYGDRLSFWGGISTQHTLPYGTPQEVRDEVKRLMDEIGRDGGYIAAPAHAIPGDAKPENVEAMLDVLCNQ